MAYQTRPCVERHEHRRILRESFDELRLEPTLRTKLECVFAPEVRAPLDNEHTVQHHAVGRYDVAWRSLGSGEGLGVVVRDAEVLRNGWEQTQGFVNDSAHWDGMCELCSGRQ